GKPSDPYRARTPHHRWRRCVWSSWTSPGTGNLHGNLIAAPRNSSLSSITPSKRSSGFPKWSIVAQDHACNQEPGGTKCTDVIVVAVRLQPRARNFLGSLGKQFRVVQQFLRVRLGRF